jgi:hypothetical protein
MRAFDTKGSRWGNRILLVSLLILLLIPAAYGGARSFVRLTDDSPAQGRAQVITQGIATLPLDEYVMRIVERTAPARGDAKVGRRALGFALATDEPILITNVFGPNDDEFVDVARLAPGEAYMTTDSTKQIRASLTGAPATYIGIEFVTPDETENVGTGKLLYRSDVLASPQGQHDLDLVRNVLNQQDIGTVPDTGGQVLVLATDGAIDILPGKSRRIRLAAGEGAIFDAEDLTIQPSEESAYGVPVNQLGSLTNRLQVDNAVAGYVVVVIGPEVPRTGETPTETPTADTTGTETATPATSVSETSSPSGPTATEVTANGSIGVIGHLCNEGVPASDISDQNCPPIPEGFDLLLSGSGISRTLADAQRIDTAWYWTGLPPGTYNLAMSSPPGNADSMVIPESGAIAPDGGGYAITITDANPQIVTPVYFLQPAPPPPTSAQVTVVFTNCDRGENGPVNCAPPSTYQINPDPILVSRSAGTFTDAQATSSGGGSYTWDLPLATFTLSERGWPYSYVVNGTEYAGGSGYTFTVATGSPITIYVQNINYVIGSTGGLK